MDAPIHSLTRGGAAIAYRRTPARVPGQAPGVMFLGGFRSDMTRTKATALETWAVAAGHAYVRFDYRGHGISGGDWDDCTVGDWLDDALAVLDAATEGPQVLVGSSMGGWIATLAARAQPERVAGLVCVAAAPDFTERLIWDRLPPPTRAALLETGHFVQPSAYDPAGYKITKRLVEEGRRHLILGRPIDVRCPVRLLHGQADADVPWQLSLELARDLVSEDVRLTLVKDGDHRLSRPADLTLMIAAVAELVGAV